MVGLFWICLYFVVRLSGSTLLNKALAGKPRTCSSRPRPHTSKAKAKAAEFGLKAKAKA